MQVAGFLIVTNICGFNGLNVNNTELLHSKEKEIT